MGVFSKRKLPSILFSTRMKILMSSVLRRVVDTKVLLLAGVSHVSLVKLIEVFGKLHVSDRGILHEFQPLLLVLVRTDTSTVPNSTKKYTASERRTTKPVVKRKQILPKKGLHLWVVSFITVRLMRIG